MSEQEQPLFGIEKIYMKDMSLEIPHAPQIFAERDAPEVEVRIHNETYTLAQEGLYEVVLTVTVTAKLKEKTVFLVEAAQAGIFQIRNLGVPEVNAVLGTLSPTILLPYAREAVASLIGRAGFPPVTLQHMDFQAIYQQRMEELQQQSAAVPSPVPAH
jgi:preprotein translocase subunit SecB